MEEIKVNFEEHIEQRIQPEKAVFINCWLEAEIEQLLVLSVIARGYWPRYWLKFSKYPRRDKLSSSYINTMLDGIGRSKYSIHLCLQQIENHVTKNDITESDITPCRIINSSLLNRWEETQKIFWRDINRLSIELGIALGGCRQRTETVYHKFMAIVPDKYEFQELLHDLQPNKCVPYTSEKLDKDFIFEKIVSWINELPETMDVPTPTLVKFKELWKSFCDERQKERCRHYGEVRHTLDHVELPRKELLLIMCKVCQKEYWAGDLPEWLKPVKDDKKEKSSNNIPASNVTKAHNKFDVFISHHSQDKPSVTKIVQKLDDYGITCWVDEEQIRPGTSFIDALTEAICKCAVIAIFIGNSGTGKWQKIEIQNAFEKRMEKSQPVIPVLLPDATINDIPQEAFNFLRYTNHVTFKTLDDIDAFEKLIWGITGKKPVK